MKKRLLTALRTTSTIWRTRKVIFSHSFVISQEKTSPIYPDMYINMYTYRYDYILLVSLLWQKKKSDKSKLIKNSLKEWQTMVRIY